MKKNLLTAMLFFVFLFVGIQSSSAQDVLNSYNYVSTSQATAILADEITEIQEHPVIYNDLQSHPEFPHLFRKLTFYVTVQEGIIVTNAIPESIIAGAEEANDIQDESNETFQTYIDEIVGLLTQ